MQFTLKYLMATVTVIALLLYPWTFAWSDNPYFMAFFVLLGWEASFVCTLLSWWFLLRSKPKSFVRTFMVGVASGFVGSMIFPAGLILYDSIVYTDGDSYFDAVRLMGTCMCYAVVASILLMELMPGKPKRSGPAEVNDALDRIQ